MTGSATLPHFWQVVPKEYVKYLPVPLAEAERRPSAPDLDQTRGVLARRGAGAISGGDAVSCITSRCRRSARKVRLVLAEKRLPFDLRIEKVWERRPEYLELNPAGTVPTLVEDNGLVIPGFAGDLRIS